VTADAMSVEDRLNVQGVVDRAGAGIARLGRERLEGVVQGDRIGAF
jgi:hypothetical protein